MLLKESKHKQFDGLDGTFFCSKCTVSIADSIQSEGRSKLNAAVCQSKKPSLALDLGIFPMQHHHVAVEQQTRPAMSGKLPVAFHSCHVNHTLLFNI
jgi:hypothetical protein